MLSVLRAAAEPLRTGQILKLVQGHRSDAKGPSVGSAVWNFVREGRVFKRSVRGREYYAVDPKASDQIDTDAAMDGDIPAEPRDAGDGGAAV